MEKTGKVIAVFGSKAIVKITSASMECKACFAKQDCHCEGVAQFCTPINTINASVGDNVVVKIGSWREIFANLFTWIFPVLMMVIAFAVAEYIWDGLVTLIISFGVFVFFFVLLRTYTVVTGGTLACPIIAAIKPEEPKLSGSEGTEAEHVGS